ncbi:MAG: hypothetical protein SVW02_03880, partial [Candidatus Nanohaloarchaea archaeon]|nr:hypothetical protein [Candidatus Nanohaloarchaea archaeon]
MTVERADYEGNVNIGFFGVVTESFALFADDFTSEAVFPGSETARLAGTDLIGIFAAGNANGLLLPDIVSEHEQAQLDDADVPYRVLDSKHTALGNLVLCNDNGCYVSRHL